MFNNLIKEMAGKKRMSQRELSEFLEISEKSVNNKINGKTEFTHSEMVKINSLFPHKTLEYLFATNESESA